MEQLDFKPPTVKPKDWDMIINPLMKNHEPVEPPEGVTTADQLKNHLEEFCLNRHIGSDVKILKKVGYGIVMAIIILYLVNFLVNF